MPQKKNRRSTTRKTTVEKWIEMETEHKRKSLENASRHFDKNDSLSVNVLESIYGQESSFGQDRRQRGIAGAAGDFQIEKKTAARMGLDVSKDDERLSFVVAAYNAGEGRIARAQREAEAADKDPTKWEDVQGFLKAAGANSGKVKEIINYVDQVIANTKEFESKSKADKTEKFHEPLKIGTSSGGEHWITKDGRHILIDG